MTVLLKVLRSPVFRVAGTVALIALVFSRVDWSVIVDRLADGAYGWGALAVVAIDIALVLGALRWSLLLDVAELHIGPRELFRVYAVTSFANSFLPSSVGGDVARPWLVSRRGEALHKAIATVVVERVAALGALLALAWVGVAAADDGVVDTGAIVLLGAVSLGFVSVLSVAAVVARRPATRRRIPVPARVLPVLAETRSLVDRLLGQRRTLALITVFSVVFQVLVTLQIVLLAKAIRVDVSFPVAALALALVTLAILVPVTIGGFGIREGSFVVLLGAAGVAHSDAVLISLLTVAALFVATLPGAWELGRKGLKPALAEAHDHAAPPALRMDP